MSHSCSLTFGVWLVSGHQKIDALKFLDRFRRQTCLFESKKRKPIGEQILYHPYFVLYLYTKYVIKFGYSHDNTLLFTNQARR